MQTSLARRQRHRRTIHRRPAASGGSHVVRRILIAIPIVVITLAFLAGFVGVVFAVGVYNQYATGLPAPEAILSDLDFEQPSIVYDRTGEVELARLGSLRREVIAFDQIPDEMLDATTAIEDQEFWTNPGFDPIGIMSALHARERTACAPRRSRARRRSQIRCRRAPDAARARGSRRITSSLASGAVAQDAVTGADFPVRLAAAGAVSQKTSEVT